MLTEPTHLQASLDASTAGAWAAEAASGIGDPLGVRRARTQQSLLCIQGGAALMHAVPVSLLPTSHTKPSWQLSGIPCHVGLSWMSSSCSGIPLQLIQEHLAADAGSSSELMSGVQGSPRASMLLNQLARGELNSSLSTIGEHSVAGATSMSQAGGSAAGSVSGENPPAVHSRACMAARQSVPLALPSPATGG